MASSAVNGVSFLFLESRRICPNWSADAILVWGELSDWCISYVAFCGGMNDLLTGRGSFATGEQASQE